MYLRFPRSSLNKSDRLEDNFCEIEFSAQIIEIPMHILVFGVILNLEM